MTIAATEMPGLFRAADELSAAVQQRFIRAIRAELTLLVTAATLSMFAEIHRSIAVIEAIVLLAVLGCSIYLYSLRPDRKWYAARAVAESIKTSVWRYMSCAEPFDVSDYEATARLLRRLSAIVSQNREVAEELTGFLSDRQVTQYMRDARVDVLEKRKQRYLEGRILDQLGWYAKKALENHRASVAFFRALILANVLAVAFAVLRFGFIEIRFWPTELLVTLAASVLCWMQTRRYSELAASYSLAAHEIGLIREQSQEIDSESEFSSFVGDAESAFSREHTQWVARKDL